MGGASHSAFPLAFVLVLAACGAEPLAPPAVPPRPPPMPEQAKPIDIAGVGRHYVEQLAAGEPEKVHAHFDADMKSAMTVEQLGALWPGLVSQVGPLRSIREVRTAKKDQLDVVVVACEFDKALLDVRVVLDPERRITGLWVKPAEQGHNYEPPSYANLDSIGEIDLSLGEGDFTLPATLTFPKSVQASSGTCPAVVLVHGSGPNDRDETVGANKPFKDLALGLASRGICVLRYEKRTRHHATLVGERFGESLTVKEETVDDAAAGVDMLRKHAMIAPDRVFILGHSLGGYAIPRIAARTPDAKGFVILAGSTRPLEDMVLDQVRHISNVDGKLSDQETQAIAALELRVAKVKTLTAGAQVAASDLPLGIPVAYWLDLAAHDPVALIAKESRPLLVLQGERDYQVTLADFAGWKKALGGKPNAKLKQYPKLNHLFIPGEGPSTPAEYQQPGHVDVEVIDDIAEFVRGA